MIRYLVVFALLTLPAGAETTAQDPGAHKFWTKRTIVLFAIDAATKGMDAYATRRVLDHGGEEYNPISRPFVTRGTPLLAGYFASSLAIDTGLSYLLWRRGHHKLQVVPFLVGTGINAQAGISTFANTPPEPAPGPPCLIWPHCAKE
jgi:hypothetical protein